MTAGVMAQGLYTDLQVTVFCSAVVVEHGSGQRRDGKFVVWVGGNSITLMYDSSRSISPSSKGEVGFRGSGPPQGTREVSRDRRSG